MTAFESGIRFHRQGDLVRAEEAYKAALALDTENADAWHLLGLLCHQTDRGGLAVLLLERALALRPDEPEFLNHLGLAYKAGGDLRRAQAIMDRAVALRPGDSGFYNNRGLVHAAQGEAEAAVHDHAMAVRLDGTNIAARVNLGNALLLAQRKDEAIVALREAVTMAPDNAQAWHSLGAAFNVKGLLGDAHDSYSRALSIRPAAPHSLADIATVALDMGRTREAIEYLQAALRLQPNNLDFHSRLIATLNYDPSSSMQGRIAQAKLYGEVARFAGETSKATSGNIPRGEGAALRVGIVSGDLREHVVGHFLEGVLGQVDRRKIELVAFMTSPVEDAFSRRLRGLFARWHGIFGLTDMQAAGMVREDGIHVLIDLCGHTAANRLALFAHRPAPVQVSWLGYFATTGLPAMDYVLVDPVSVPPHSHNQFTETPWYLPVTRFCLTPPVTTDVESLPALKAGYLTFASFQNMAKINDDVVRLWARVLLAVPSSRLRIQCRQMACPRTRSELQARLMQAGINAGRLTLIGAVSRQEYLQAHAEVDMILDTFPFPGGTTTCEALWMGVPTLTLRGQSLLSRQGVAILSAVGLDGWVADGEDEYVRMAQEYASNWRELSGLRAGLRARAQASALFDTARFARDLEVALEGMWAARGASAPLS